MTIMILLQQLIHVDQQVLGRKGASRGFGGHGYLPPPREESVSKMLRDGCQRGDRPGIPGWHGVTMGIGNQ